MDRISKQEFDPAKVNEVWDEYARTHDLVAKGNMAVGIDPDTREVFMGESAREIVATLKQDGRFRPLYFRRVGGPYYTHRVGRR